MEDLDKFISFIFKNIDEERIELIKKMKYGCRYYYIHIHLHYDKTNSNTGLTSESSKELSIIFDTRNQCIEIGKWENYLVFEDTELLTKWVNILEEYYNNRSKIVFNDIIGEYLSNTSSCDRDLWRQWSVNKIIED